MNTHSRRITQLTLLLTLFLPCLKAQQRDFQVWPSVGLNLEIVKNLELEIEEEVRFRENATLIDRQVNDLSLNYRFNRYFKAGLNYRLEAQWVNADDYNWRNGFSGDLSLRMQPARFTLAYRLRLQSLKVERFRNETAFSGGYRHRHKIEAEYDIQGVPLVPFASGELFIEQKTGAGAETSALRLWIGLEYRYRKLHRFNIRYGIDREYNQTDPLTAYLLAFGYSLHLKRAK
ncbi:MAG: DUF2490 domain-containing protein [Bacteroidales bacterium]|nr:DUF2490 domain-containing protein [Bacteroidales bacterium]